MTNELIKVEKIHKIFIEYIMVDEQDNVTIQTRKFTKEDRADYFINQLSERGVVKCSKKVITKIAFVNKEEYLKETTNKEDKK